MFQSHQNLIRIPGQGPPIRSSGTSNAIMTIHNQIHRSGSASKRRLRRNILRQSIGKISVAEAILLCNIPPLCTINEIEQILHNTAGLGRFNSAFYIEIQYTPVSVDALIKFFNPAHTVRAVRKLECFGYKVLIQNENIPDCRIDNGFRLRFTQHMVAINAKERFSKKKTTKVKQKIVYVHVQNDVAPESVPDSVSGQSSINVNSVKDNPIANPESCEKPTTEELLNIDRPTTASKIPITTAHTTGSNNSTCTSIFNQEPTDFDKFAKIYQEMYNFDKVDMQQESIDKQHVDLVRQEPNKNFTETKDPKNIIESNDATKDTSNSKDGFDCGSVSKGVTPAEEAKCIELIKQAYSNHHQPPSAARRSLLRQQTFLMTKCAEAILICDLSPTCTNTEIEELLQKYAGLNSSNSPFYIEVLRAPLKSDVLIKFLFKSHTKKAAFKFMMNGYKVIPQGEKLPNCRIDNGFRLRFMEHTAVHTTINAEVFAQMLANNKEFNEHASKNVTTENVSNENLEEQSTNNKSSVIDENVTNASNSLEKAIIEELTNINEAIDASDAHIEPEQTGVHSSDADDSNDSTSTFVLKEEHIDFDEFSTIHQDSAEINTTVDIKQGFVQYEDTIKQEPCENYNDNHPSEDKSNNFDPNEIEIKEEPIGNNYSEEITSVANKSENVVSITNESRDEGSNEIEIKKEPIDNNYSEELTSETNKSDSVVSITNEIKDKWGGANVIEIKEEPLEDNLPEDLLSVSNTFFMDKSSGDARKMTVSSEDKHIYELNYDSGSNDDDDDNAASDEQGNDTPRKPRRRRPRGKGQRAKHGRPEHDQPISKRRKLDYNHPNETTLTRNNPQACNSRRQSLHPGSRPEIPPSNEELTAPEQENSTDYGFKPEFLQNLGLKTPLTNVINVNELHESVDKAKLREVFSLAGDVKQITINSEQRSARIEYDHPVEAVQAICMFQNQTLFEKKICMEMDYSPKQLPVGLSGINNGFTKYGKPLKGIRPKMELRAVYQILHDLGGMKKVKPPKNSPFSAWYQRETKSVTPNSITNSPTVSSTTVPLKNTSEESITETDLCNDVSSDMDVSSDEDSNEKSKPSNNNAKPSDNNTQPSDDNNQPCNNDTQTSDNNIQVIEELGAVLKARGLIPSDLDCKDAKSILAAIKSNPVPVNEIDKKKVDNNSQTTEQILTNASSNLANETQKKDIPQIGQNQQQASANQKDNRSIDNDSQTTIQTPTNVLPNLANIPLPTFEIPPPFVPMAGQNPQQVSAGHRNVDNNGLNSVQVPNFSYGTQNYGIQNAIGNAFLMPPPPPPPRPESRDPRLNRTAENAIQRLADNRSNPGFDKGSGGSQQSKRCHRLIFRNLPPGVSEAELSSKMREVGDLLYCEGPTKNGLAIVAFSTLQDAELCLRLFHRAKVDGQVIDVIDVI